MIALGKRLLAVSMLSLVHPHNNPWMETSEMGTHAEICVLLVMLTTIIPDRLFYVLDRVGKD